MSTHWLAQLNIARMKESLASPTMADFVANLERINALADASPGFVWRLKDEDDAGGAEAIRLFGNDHVVNMSLWVDVESLSAYAFQSGHADIMRRRREWFEAIDEAHTVLWWVEKGRYPTVAEAKERLLHLREFGATPRAFTFKQAFAAPDAAAAHSQRPLRAP
jgi:hypothetical protein